MSESKNAKAIRLLKEKPFEFIDYGAKRETLPKGFTAPDDDTHWTEATAIYATLRSKPATWQWNSQRLRHLGSFSSRAVRRGVGALKRAGYVQHVNVYDERSDLLTTFLLVFSEPIPEEQRKGRFAMVYSDQGWRVRAPGGQYKIRSGIGSQGSDMSVHPPYRHYKTVENEPKPFSRAESLTSQSEPEDDTPLPPEEPAKQDLKVEQSKYLIKRLRQLGEQKTKSEDAELDYEEFVIGTLLPALELPPLPEEHRSRKKIWNLQWVENNLLGFLLLELSSSENWDVRCARRIIRRANEGYITRDDIRILLFTFNWQRQRSTRKTLAAMTYYGKQEDPQAGGKPKLHDAWKKMINSAKHEYANMMRQVHEQRSRLHPDKDDEYSVNWSTLNRIEDQMREICTGRKIPDDKRIFGLGVHTDAAMGYILSLKQRTEENQRIIDEAHDELVEFLATDFTGVLVYRKHFFRLEEAAGITPEEVQKAHREHTDKLSRRASYHGIDSRRIVPLI